MIAIENVEVYGWEAAIRGARNPMNSWDKSDTRFFSDGAPKLGESDYKLLRNLANAGPDHGKYLRMITVTVDLTAMQPWWSEFDTYKVGTVRNSCSKMHKIHVEPFTIDNFAHEGLDQVPEALEVLEDTIACCEYLRKMFNQTQEKRYWRALIELLPHGYMMKATISLNYEVLVNIYQGRRHHKVDEWHTFCDWIEQLPYSELITGGDSCV